MNHGTLDAYKNHACRCEPCRVNYSRYNKRREYLAQSGRSLRVDSLGTRRRIRALMALGYGLPRLAAELGIATGNLSKKFHQPYVLRTTHVRVAEMYERLAMLPPPLDQSARRTRNIGRKREWPPPLAFDDIDDPNETPSGRWKPHSPYDSKHAAGCDPVVVLRLLDGEQITSTRAEKDEAMRRWLSMGNSEQSLCAKHSWRGGRYGKAS